MSKIKKKILNILNSIEIVDIHTHLFPPEFKSYYKSGLVELLNYHYLVVEFLSSSKYDPEKFFSLKPIKRAQLVWDFIFINNTPISDAAIGIIKIFNFLKIKNLKNKDLLTLIAEIDNKFDLKKFLKKNQISKIVMTNNPCDEKEWALFKNKKWDRKTFLSSIRIDDFFKKNSKYSKLSNSIFYKFIRMRSLEARPVYFALSCDGPDIKKIFKSKKMKIILKLLKQEKIPLMILVGVKREVNKKFREGGDGVGSDDLSQLEEVVNNNKENTFIVTHLSNNSQYKLTVLSRKLPNLTLFGIWWHLNQDQYQKEILLNRISLLGFNFLPQHSDSRVSEQLIYKWENFKQIISEVLSKKYEMLDRMNYKINKKDIERDLNKLFHQNYRKLLG